MPSVSLAWHNAETAHGGLAGSSQSLRKVLLWYAGAHAASAAAPSATSAAVRSAHDARPAHAANHAPIDREPQHAPSSSHADSVHASANPSTAASLSPTAHMARSAAAVSRPSPPCGSLLSSKTKLRRVESEASCAGPPAAGARACARHRCGPLCDGSGARRRRRAMGVVASGGGAISVVGPSRRRRLRRSDS